MEYIREKIAFVVYCIGMSIALLGARIMNKETYQNLLKEFDKGTFDLVK